VKASEIKAAREQLILKRSQIIKELRTRRHQWREFEQVCRVIVESANDYDVPRRHA
jgi:hypothetical protein